MNARNLADAAGPSRPESGARAEQGGSNATEVAPDVSLEACPDTAPDTASHDACALRVPGDARHARASDPFAARDAFSEIRFAVCITTMNRTETLDACLANLARCVPPPACVVVSDDSPASGTREANAAVVARYPGVAWLAGPRRGVCANRNNAVMHCLAHAVRCTHVSFIDDDVQPAPDFFAVAKTWLTALPAARRTQTVLTGGPSSTSADFDDAFAGRATSCAAVRLSFAGYFTAAERPECVNIHAAVFPLALFRTERWDENIYFGSEDAELSLRAMKRGYPIELVPALRSRDTQAGKGVLATPADDAPRALSRYELCCEAARLYIGVKRYRSIDPSVLKLAAFASYWLAHMTVYLARRGALRSLPEIVRRSNVWRAWRRPPSACARCG
ncbi:glycosyltransferase family 2 protein [Paraburkholderia kururiensis]|uniref:Glycosyltransferase n=1 Tax=Paraburkholderia kururiensis TaxID=984307 RepID=A0ABZ0WSW9_9BURK|nr:glycosyltransferase [Paraburkholderia kururiensis]WQD80311.1 glycosyltransferase [Paraburkholderia kururiensis]